jgi:hypothetical protein
MERTFLSRLSFNLYVAGSTFAKYYFGLRALSEQKTFRSHLLKMVGAAHAAPAAVVQRIEESTKGLRETLYSKSL